MTTSGFAELARQMQDTIFDTFGVEEDSVSVLYYPKSGIGPIAIDGVLKRPAQEESGLVSNVVRFYTRFETTSVDPALETVNGIPLGPATLDVSEGFATINGQTVSGITPIRGDELVMYSKRYVVQDVDVNRIGGCTLNLRSK